MATIYRWPGTAPAPTAAEQHPDAGRLLDAILHHVADGLLLVSRAEQITLMNERFGALLGLPGTAAEWLGQPSQALVTSLIPLLSSPGDLEQVRQQVRGASGILQRFELRLLNGRVLEVEAQRLDEGAGGFLVSCRDVTERHRANQALEESRAFNRLVLDTTPNLVYVRNAAGHMVYENPATRQLQAQIRLQRQRADSDPTAAHEVQAYARADAYVLHTGAELRTEDAFTLASGEVRWYQTTKRVLVRPDGERQVLGVSTDITGLKRSEMALARREKQYHDLQHHTQAIICTHDLQGILRGANPAALALLGQGQEQVLGRNVREMVAPADLEQMVNYLAELARTGEATGVMRVPDAARGGLRHLHYRSLLVPAAANEPAYVVAHAHDITERVEMEQELRHTRDAAEAAATAREVFLANMSHEIRTPLHGMLGMASMLAKSTLDNQQRTLVDVVLHSGQHLLGVLNDVLDMAKISSGKLTLALAPFDLCASVQGLMPVLANQARGKGLAFLTEPLPEHVAVLGDAHRLNQVLLNLVANAIKFTPKGHVLVRSQELHRSATHLSLRISVSDTGIGIAPDKLAVIFEGFTQAQADTARQYGGTGLGLSICRALVQQMGGTLTVSSTLGQGSTFVLDLALPLADAAPVPAAPVPAVPGALHGTRILLVEDNAISRDVARLLLESWGVVLDEAATGPEALALFDQHCYDVVLMDIQLPGMTGVEVTRRLRQHPDPGRARTYIIALTANAFSTDTAGYLAAGLDDVLSKPFHEPELYAKLAARRPTTAPPLYSLDALHEVAQGRTSFVERILRSFLTHMPASVAQLREAAAASRWPEVVSLAHHIKPNVLALNVLGVGEALLLLEHAPPSPAHESHYQAAVKTLLTQVELVLAALPAELAQEFAVVGSE